MNRTAFFPRMLLTGLAGIATLALLAACADSNGRDAPGSGAAATSAPPASGAAATSAPPGAVFNDADVSFAQNMISHHQQAVQMAELAASRASQPEVKQLATQIKAAQGLEIKTLTGWLTAWGKPIEPPGGHGGHAMPGMMSDAELAKLKAATGAGFDRMFAQMMIANRNGAIQMARQEQTSGANPDAKALAATIERTQAEVTQLQKILDRL